MPIITDPCVFLENDGDRLSLVRLVVKEQESITPEQWTNVNLLEEVIVLRHRQTQNNSTSHQPLMELALAIRSFPNLSAISLIECALDDIGPLGVAMTSSSSCNDKKKRASFTFHNCSLTPRAAQTLQTMLRTNNIAELSFEYCDFSKAVCGIIGRGLSGSQSSLQSFRFTYKQDPTSSNFPMVHYLAGDLYEYVMNNEALKHLSLTLDDSDMFWKLFRSVEYADSLKSLELWNSQVNLHAMEALMSLCMGVTSFTKLKFTQCRLTEDAFEYMFRLLSKVQVIDSLILNLIVEEDETIDIVFGELQVKHLVVRDAFTCQALSYTLDHIARNLTIQCLELGGATLASPRAFQKLCDVLLRRNCGPTELILECLQDKIGMLTDAMQVNTSVKTLTLDGIEDDGVVILAQGLANMRGLRKLTLQYNVDYTEEFFQALVQSLEVNSTLCSLSMDKVEPHSALAEKYLPRIKYLLDINRVGRRQLLSATPSAVPVALWPYVLERSSNACDGIYFALREKPDLISPSRKRKNQCDEN